MRGISCQVIRRVVEMKYSVELFECNEIGFRAGYLNNTTTIKSLLHGSCPSFQALSTAWLTASPMRSTVGISLVSDVRIHAFEESLDG